MCDVDCFKDPAFLVPVKDGPFYAAHWGCMISSTRCGLKTDDHARVIDTNGKPIPGLYAAGNNGGRFYGSTYPGTMGGTGIGHGQFFAFTAARDCLGEDVVNTEAQVAEAMATQPDPEFLMALAQKAGLDPSMMSGFTPSGAGGESEGGLDVAALVAQGVDPQKIMAGDPDEIAKAAELAGMSVEEFTAALAELG